MVDRRARGRDAGTTLLLVPAMTLVLLALAAIAVDMSAVHLARRELVGTVSRAADDAASTLDMDQLRRTGAVRVDLEAARRVATAEIRAADLAGRVVGTPVVRGGPAPDTVLVTATIEVDRLFAGVVPGAPPVERITVTATGQVLDVADGER